MTSPGIRSSRKTMQPAGRLIGKMKLSGDIKDPEVRARAAWNAAAGKKIAGHTRAAALVRDTLIVEVEDMVWQYQLNTLRHFLIRNIAKILGEAVVREIDFRPMPRRLGPQLATSARTDTAGIEDPVMALLYEQSRRKAI
jgi:predicted nucleic acid-binding Zn ribbon protein